MSPSPGAAEGWLPFEGDQHRLTGPSGAGMGSLVMSLSRTVALCLSKLPLCQEQHLPGPWALMLWSLFPWVPGANPCP